jgi:hypothetical protein
LTRLWTEEIYRETEKRADDDDQQTSEKSGGFFFFIIISPLHRIFIE